MIPGRSSLPLLVVSMGGLGDGVYQRPFVRAQAELRDVYITTPWPELYEDLPRVRPVFPRSSMKLRTQEKNVARQPRGIWCTPPSPYDRAVVTYRLRGPGSILEDMERYIGLAGRPFVFDLPRLGPAPIVTEKPIAVVRPVTLRREWANSARNPMPEYVAAAAAQLRAAGYLVVLIADIEPPEERLVGELPPADAWFLRGELPPRQLVALIQSAAVVVGGAGFIVPLAIAAGTPLVVISGGQGGHNAPERLTDLRMDLSRTRFLLPDRFCMCTKRDHPCDKTISGFGLRFAEALLEVTGAQRAEVAA